MRYDRKRVLITGGAGFIGSHLCERFAKAGDHVVCLDNFSTGQSKKLDGLTNRQNVELIHHDVTVPFKIDVDLILNFACPASPPKYQADPIGTLRTNFLGMSAMLDLAHALDVPIVQASTSEVYGDPQTSVQNESYWGNVNPVGPRACYDEGKRIAETLCYEYRRQKGVDARIIRIFNTYGPRMSFDDGRVVSNFIVSALRGEPLPIYGDGKQTRSFCYVDDLVEGIWQVAHGKSLRNLGPMNLGNDKDFTMIELADLIFEILQTKKNITYKELPENDPKQRKPDLALARQLIGYAPKVDLKTGLEMTIAHFRHELSL